MLHGKRQSFVWCFWLGKWHQNPVRTGKQFNLEICIQLRPFVVLQVFLALGLTLICVFSYENSIQAIVVTLWFSLKNHPSMMVYDFKWRFIRVWYFLRLIRNPPLVRVTRAQNVCTEIIYIALQTPLPSSQKQSFPLNKQHQMAKIKFQVHMNVMSKLLSKWNWWWNFTCVSKISLNSLNLTFSLQDNNHMVKDVY